VWSAVVLMLSQQYHLTLTMYKLLFNATACHVESSFGASAIRHGQLHCLPAHLVMSQTHGPTFNVQP